MFNNYRFRKNINDSEDIFPSPYLHSMFFNKYRFRNNIDSEDIYPPPYLHSMTLTAIRINIILIIKNALVYFPKLAI